MTVAGGVLLGVVGGGTEGGLDAEEMADRSLRAGEMCEGAEVGNGEGCIAVAAVAVAVAVAVVELVALELVLSVEVVDEIAVVGKGAINEPSSGTTASNSVVFNNELWSSVASPCATPESLPQ